MKNTRTLVTPLGEAALQKPLGEVVPAPYVWDRAWIVLGRPHLEFISRKAHELGFRSPSYVVQQLIEGAMAADLVDR